MSTYGIDLGTTYSCIATLDGSGNPVIIRNQVDSSETLASAVYFESADNVIIGDTAKEAVETDGARVVQFVKREIGKADARVYTFDDKTYTPVEISAMILSRLKQMVEEQGGTVDKVVITHPARFGLEEMMATKKAGELAGLEVVDLINEPTAAALSYCARQFQEERTIMVYDLGGGTFDVSVIKMSMEMNAEGQEVQKVKVVATDGNDRLGGKDWDDRLFEHIKTAACEEMGITPDMLDTDSLQSIRSWVEKTKKKLSATETAKVRCKINGEVVALEVTRQEFEAMTADLVAQTMTFVENVLNKLRDKTGSDDVDTVLLVGGSTFMPMIRNVVEDRFPGRVQLEDPNLAVAKGAAIRANMFLDTGSDEQQEPSGQGDGTNDQNTNKTTNGPSEVTQQSGPSIEVPSPRSFGPAIMVRSDDGSVKYMVDNLIKVGDVLPATAVGDYATMVDNQERIVLRAFESMSEDSHTVPCVDNQGAEQYTDPALCVKMLGDMELALPAGLAAGSPIKVTFTVSTSGVYVRAEEVTGGRIVETTFKMGSDIDMDNSAFHDMIISGE